MNLAAFGLKGSTTSGGQVRILSQSTTFKRLRTCVKIFTVIKYCYRLFI